MQVTIMEQREGTHCTTGDDSVALGGPVDAGDSLAMLRQGGGLFPLGASFLVDLHLRAVQGQRHICKAKATTLAL